MIKTIVISSIVAISSLSCRQDVEVDNHTQAAKQEIKRAKAETRNSFVIDNISFKVKPFRTGGVTSPQKIPKGFNAITDTLEVNFLIPFQKSLYTITSPIPLQKLKDDSLYLEIFAEDYFKNDSEVDRNDPFIQFVKQNKFTFTEHDLDGYGKVFVGIVSTNWANAVQNNCAIIINNERKEISVWNYDDIQFTPNGNIMVSFRLKERKTWYYYSYDSLTNCFMPIATK